MKNEQIMAALNASQNRMFGELRRIDPSAQTLAICATDDGGVHTSSKLDNRMAGLLLVQIGTSMLRAANAGPWWREKQADKADKPKRSIWAWMRQNGLTRAVPALVAGAVIGNGAAGVMRVAGGDYSHLVSDVTSVVWGCIALTWCVLWSKGQALTLAVLESSALTEASNAQLMTALEAHAKGEAEITMLPMPEETAH